MNPHSNTEAIRVAHRGRAGPAGARGGCWPLLTANRAWLRAHHIRATIPVKADQAVHRRTRGSRGGRPPTFDAVTHKNRNTVERGFSHLKHHKPWPPATTSSPCATSATIHVTSINHWLTRHT